MASSDCVFLNIVMGNLSPNNNYNQMQSCCTWDIVECDSNQFVTKLDLSKVNISKEMEFPSMITNLNNIKDFSLKGQKNINNIFSFNSNQLEKLDLSGTGINSSIFPQWIVEAPKLRELYLADTKLEAVPQGKFKSTNLKTCSLNNTPICSTYQTSSFDFIPQICKDSCSTGKTSSTEQGTSSESSSSSWPYILIIGVILLIVLLVGGYLFIRNKKKNSKYRDYSNNNSQKPILPIAKKTSENSSASQSPYEQIININNNKPKETEKEMEEAARNNYSNAYGADINRNQSIENEKESRASVKDIYRQHNASTSSFSNEKRSISHSHSQQQQQQNSLYDTINNQDESLENTKDEEIISNEIIGIPEAAAISGSTNILVAKEKENKEPELLHRKSSKRNCSRSNSQVTASTTKSNNSNSNVNSDQDEIELYIANWDYQPTLTDELTLKAGDIIEIRKVFDDGWSSGLNRRTQQSGIVPMCYLKSYEN